ncbi:hypothetical protein GC163_17190 [bacterium]|nr:hypothetical protein [bacterium]
MDIVYIFRHSRHRDEELRYSLRSVARYTPWIRKVWIFGDRPTWLSHDTQRIEHVPHDIVAWIEGFQTPLTNTFLMWYMVALLPDVASEFLTFTDDYILLREFTPQDAVRRRYLNDLDAASSNRGSGLFAEALWRTYDILRRLQLPRLNYELHVPLYLKKSQVLAAVQTFRPYMCEDRFFGPLAQSAIMNHIQSREPFTSIKLAEENSYAGFHWKPARYDDVVAQCAGRQFLNFDDDAFGPDLLRFLRERFPDPCEYEVAGLSSVQLISPATAGINTPIPATTTQPLGIPVPFPSAKSLEPRRCAVLVPYRQFIAPACESGLRELEQRGYVVRRCRCDSASDRVRSQLASDALADGFEETLWIHGDVGFQADAVEELRRRQLPLCGGILPIAGQRSLALQILPETAEIVLGKAGGLIELQGLSTAFLHVRREVYDRMAEQLSLPACVLPTARPLTPYFLPLIQEERDIHRYLNDEFAFCQRARSCGFAIVADTTLRLTLLAEADYSWEEAGSDKRRFETYRYQFSQPNPTSPEAS